MWKYLVEISNLLRMNFQSNNVYLYYYIHVEHESSIKFRNNRYCDVSLLCGTSAIASWSNRRSVTIRRMCAMDPARPERKKKGGSERGHASSWLFFVVLREQSKIDEM
jgi:hypothetical protein